MSLLLDQLMALQFECTKLGFTEAFAWLGKQIALLEKGARKRKRKRGIWVRMADTGERVMLDADVVEEAVRALRRD